MNDRELLEMAAKAAGIIGITRDGGIELSKDHAKPPYDWRMWNPLSDDGDALRLAVALRMDIRIYGTDVRVFCCGVTVLEGPPDFCAATRRAIVRAAAEIGREMK